MSMSVGLATGLLLSMVEIPDESVKKTVIKNNSRVVVTQSESQKERKRKALSVIHPTARIV
jgi:hypothetical protein